MTDHSDMSTEDLFTSDELYDTDLGSELRTDAADDARAAAEAPSCCHTHGHHVHCPGF